ncbi:CLUMA_CG012952, isoform A [Clunio marinus]|uniref:CLUMA_CG012952, isoform A n=1 Tax=Clunio marinus TaxID=568069 RepID=A0A1J1IME7_9DIPT|nr:CLUMA_CG012952, isoform A [Clunio marinus]
MKRVIIFILFVTAVRSAEENETRVESVNDSVKDSNETETIKNEILVETSDMKPASTLYTTKVPESTTEQITESTTQNDVTQSISESATSTVVLITRPTDSSESTEESSEEESENVSIQNFQNILPPSNDKPKRKVLYVNQQQHGKLNVHLELSDVSVIVIPNQKDPQVSLLNLLLKSAQKSKLQENEQKIKEEGESLKSPSVETYHDDYSKYKQTIRHSDESYQPKPSIPLIESRAPYKVDISSSLTGQQSQQPAVEVIPNASFSRSPIMKLLQPIPVAIQHVQPGLINRRFRRSIDTNIIGLNPGYLSDDGNYGNYNEDEYSEFNTIYNEDLNVVDSNDGSEFVLLGATENCGPGRKRNSYQICVAVDDMK